VCKEYTTWQAGISFGVGHIARKSVNDNNPISEVSKDPNGAL